MCTLSFQVPTQPYFSEVNGGQRDEGSSLIKPAMEVMRWIILFFRMIHIFMMAKEGQLSYF